MQACFKVIHYGRGNTFTITLSFYKVMVEQKKITVEESLIIKKRGGITCN